MILVSVTFELRAYVEILNQLNQSLCQNHLSYWFLLFSQNWRELRIRIMRAKRRKKLGIKKNPAETSFFVLQKGIEPAAGEKKLGFFRVFSGPSI